MVVRINLITSIGVRYSLTYNTSFGAVMLDVSLFVASRLPVGDITIKDLHLSTIQSATSNMLTAAPGYVIGDSNVVRIFSPFIKKCVNKIAGCSFCHPS
ncbi:hypothetical protein D3C75_507470 [compost metagenome]